MNRLIFLLFLLVANKVYGQVLEDSLKAELNHVSDDSTKVLIYQKLAWETKYVKPRHALSYLDTAYIISEKLKSPVLTANVVYYRAIIHYLVNENSEAIFNANKAKVIYELEKHDYGIASIHNLLGLINNRLGDYESTINHYYESLKIAERGTNQYARSNPLHNIALVYIDMGEYENALEPELKAFEIRKEIGDSTFIGQSLETIGVIKYHLGFFDEAEDYLLSAQHIFLPRGDVNSLSINHSNLGLVYTDTRQFTKAIASFNKAIEECGIVENYEGLINALNNLSSVYIELREFEAADSLAQKAVNLSTEYDLLPNLKESLASYANALESANKIAEAFFVTKKLMAISDSLLNSEKTKQIANLEVRYETEKKEQQIALQSAEISEQKAQNQRNLAVIIGLIFIVILLISVILLVRSRARKKQALLQQEAEIKFREMQIEAAISSQEKERSRFAKDLHDGFGQMISILNLNLKSLEAGDQDKHEVFENSSKVLDEMYQELKGICFNLMPQTLIKHGITAALKEFASRINLTNQLLVETDFFGLEERLSDVQEISLYRITQEWVNNVIKYSDADKVMIQITRDEEEITLLIEDNGTGFDEELLKSGKGNGWKNMNSRANLINGKLELDTSPGMKGSTLILETVPEKIPHRVLT